MGVDADPGPPAGPREAKDGEETQEAVPPPGDPARDAGGSRGGARDAGAGAGVPVRRGSVRGEGRPPRGALLPLHARVGGALDRRGGVVRPCRRSRDRGTVRVPYPRAGGRAECPEAPKGRGVPRTPSGRVAGDPAPGSRRTGLVFSWGPRGGLLPGAPRGLLRSPPGPSAPGGGAGPVGGGRLPPPPPG